MSGYLYRFYDVDGALLYVGSTTSITRRIMEHKYTAPFYDQINRTDVTVYQTIEAARGAEVQVIGEERPLHNKQNNGNHSDYVLPDWVDALVRSHRSPENEPVGRISNWPEVA